MPKKPTDPSKQSVLPNDLADYAAMLSGLTPDELLKLFESIERIDKNIVVTRRKAIPGKQQSKVVRGKDGKMPISKAIEYEKKRADALTEKELRIKELFRVEGQTLLHDPVNQDIYPKRLTPLDIVRCTESAEDRLSELDRLRHKQKKVYSPREEVVLNVLETIKRLEVARVATFVAEKQRSFVLNKTLEDLEAEKQARIQQLKDKFSDVKKENDAESGSQEKLENGAEQTPQRMLESFNKNNRTLTDEAGELIDENIDAAAAVVKQWIGNIVTENP
ncbi:MAG: hypothetical protein ACRCUY_02390 [Thermoguttaceae bacterium]